MLTPFRYFVASIFFLSLASAADAQTGGIGGTGNIGGMSNATGGTTPTGGGIGGTTAPGGAIGGTTATGGAATDVSTLGSNAAQSFIGANATQGFIGGATGTNNQQRTNRQFRALQNNNQQQTQQTTGTPRAIKTTLRVGFVFPSAPQLASVGRMANANVASMNRFVAQRPDLAGIKVDLNSSGVAVLTGSASTEETRRLAANLMRIQPGVRKIENQVVVQAE